MEITKAMRYALDIITARAMEKDRPQGERIAYSSAADMIYYALDGCMEALASYDTRVEEG